MRSVKGVEAIPLSISNLQPTKIVLGLSFEGKMIRAAKSMINEDRLELSVDAIIKIR
jgi:hypothetical protein